MVGNAVFDDLDFHARQRPLDFLSHAIVIEANVHGRRIWRPHPDRDLRAVCRRMADIKLGRVEFPEVAHPEDDATAGTTNIP